MRRLARRALSLAAIALVADCVSVVPDRVGAAQSYPSPLFSQVHAAMTQYEASINPLRCNLDSDGLTCHLVVDAGTGFGTVPAPFTSAVGSQVPSGYQFIGVAGSDGTHAEPLLTDATGRLQVAGTFAATTTFPYTTAAVVPTPASFIGISGFDGTYVRPLSVTSTGAMNVSGTISATTTFPYASGTPNQSSAAASAIAVAGWDGSHVQPLSVNTSGALNIAGTVGTTFPFTTVSGSQSGQAGAANSAIGIAGYNGATNDVVRVGPAPAAADTPLPAGTPGVLVTKGTYAGGAVAVVANSPVPMALSSSLPTGTNSIGAVTLNTGGIVGLASGSNTIGNIGSISTLPSLPAGSNLIGSVTANAGTGFPSTGTAGSPASTVLTIQGITSGQPVPVTGSFSVTQPYPPAPTATPASGTSFVGVGGTNGASFIPLPIASAAATQTTGYAVVVQGPGTNGAMPISGNVTPLGNFSITGSTGSTIGEDSNNNLLVSMSGNNGSVNFPASTTNPTVIPTYGYNTLTFTVGTALSSGHMSFSGTPYAAVTTGANSYSFPAYCKGSGGGGWSTQNVVTTPGSWECPITGMQSFIITPSASQSAAQTITYHLSMSSMPTSSEGYPVTGNLGNGIQSGIPYGLNGTSINAGYNAPNTNTAVVGADNFAGGALAISDGGNSYAVCNGNTSGGTVYPTGGTPGYCWFKYPPSTASGTPTPGRVARITILSSATGAFNCYDGYPSAYTGTVPTSTPSAGVLIYPIASSAAAGAQFDIQIPFNNGFSCLLPNTSSPTILVTWY